ncbi:DUF4249 domain-containing protein [Spirosoma fluviale]|uniref:DUF4249 domain-containing protein n=1 Tax=Spirosoma fluviale TaxID=1597977 RepID=A0A286G4G5_9BACT|nr:DUF4249 domain-containing protein [Spirosoma fluviale]SOD90447.1 protein of unknown function [Spirosoma fluviale]
MMNPAYLLFGLPLLLLMGCGSLRQEVDPKGVVGEGEQVVVTCFISPQDTVLAARVSRSLPILGLGNQNDLDIPNATVTLSDGSQSVILRLQRRADPYNYGTMSILYRALASELAIVAGKRYTLTVQVPDGRQIRASCTVPEPVQLDQVELDSSTINEYGLIRKDYYARLHWQDPARQTNYYRVAGNNAYTYNFRFQPGPNTPVRDSTGLLWGDWTFSSAAMLTDVGRDGQAMRSGRGRLAINYLWINGQQQSSLARGPLYAYLLNVDENYYRYHEAIDRQRSVGDNPFAEPVLVPTTVQGGLGCFGAYNRSTLALQVN